jgi:alcohol dehydrogenase class IV
MRTTWSFYSAGTLIFGEHAVRRLGETARRLAARRILVVTDAVLERVGVLAQVRDALVLAGIEVVAFMGGEPEPSFETAEACLAFARAVRPDALLGLGGGSNMDLAKATAVLLAHGGNPADYVGEDRVPGPVHPLICVPTTAGTGSEVSSAAVLTDTANRLKVSILSNYLRPRAAIVDPLLTHDCPPHVTADSGIDALTHAIESLTAIDYTNFPLADDETSLHQGKTPLADLFAERAVKLIGQHLRRAVADGNDREARSGMALAATLAGLAFSNSAVALVHALEYPVGGLVHVSHGRGNGLLLPYVMRFNLDARRPQLARIAQLLGEDVAGLSETDAALRAVAAVERLRSDVGIPNRLADIGIATEHLPTIAAKAFGIQRLMRVNPRPVTADDLLAILQLAL